jgi:hypothetical protein
LRYRRDGFSVQAAIDKGRALPDWYLAKPDLEPGEDAYLQAFWLLGTGRAVGSYTIGSIPWRDMVSYADRLGLSGSTHDLFVRVISEMDAGYLAWKAEEMKARKTPPKDPDDRRHRIQDRKLGSRE